jgi:hypothetical protein
MAAFAAVMHKFVATCDADVLSTVEAAAVERLAVAYARYPSEVDMKSEAWYSACTELLEAAEATSQRLGIRPASRQYRDTFTVNYRALFPDNARHYRVDVYRASLDQCAAIWVNGDTFEFSARVLRLASELQSAVMALGARLKTRSGANGAREIRSLLVKMDTAWANFEKGYISELIAIEEQARRYLVRAVEHESRLQTLERSNVKNQEYLDERRRFVACIGQLNSVANSKRRGRDDFTVDVLDCAENVLRCCSSSASDCDVARTLATEVVESYSAMRRYIREVGSCLECVDPNLCKNAGLVERLVDWEESWELGVQYVQKTILLKALCNVVAEVRAAQDLVPKLVAMRENYDAEFFLALPRLLWLAFLDEPERCAPLFEALLPNRFNAGKLGADLTEFLQQYRRTTESVPSHMLVKQAVFGPGSTQGPKGTSEIAEGFLREMEGWSMEMQRRCPEDWNQCSSVIVRCLDGIQNGDRNGEFRV